jgi:signal transduction histidine kinase
MKLQISYEAEKKDRQIAENKLAIKNKDFQIFILIGAVFLMVIVSGGIYKYQKQKRERIKTELEYKNQLDNAEMENKLSSEKLRISRELHDNIGSKLTFIISSLDNLTYKYEEGNIFNRLNSVSQYGRETLSELRNTIWAIKHESGTISDLILKINDNIQKVNSNIGTLQIILRNNISRTYNLSSTQMLNIYRIIQEAVQNTIKYSNADKMFIEFFETVPGFSITIKDNGKGFDISRVSAGNGLKNMETRCKEADGIFSINSGTDGTKILCEFRINQADDVLN